MFLMRSCHLLQVEIKILVPIQAFLGLGWQRFWIPCHSVESEVLSPSSPLVVCIWEWGGQQFFLWCLARAEWLLLKYFLSLGCSFSGLLNREKTLLMELLLFTTVGINKLPVSSAPSLEYMRQIENPRNLSLCQSPDPNVTSQTAFFFSTLQDLFIFVLYVM